MLYEMRLAAQVLQKEGWASVLKRMWRYVVKWPNYIFFALKMRQLHLNGDSDLPNAVKFAFDAYDGLIMPLQVRSEILQLLSFMQSKQLKNILEIGTSNGGTLFLLSRIAATDACIISIDLPLGAYGGGYPAWKRPFYRFFASNDQKVHLIRADSHAVAAWEKVAAILNGQQIDLLFIDGDHTYGGVKKDFGMYEPLVKTGGSIVLHDIVSHSTGSGCGVDLYWDEIKNDHEHVEFIENRNQQWAGLGLIVKGNPAGQTKDEVKSS